MVGEKLIEATSHNCSDLYKGCIAKTIHVMFDCVFAKIQLKVFIIFGGSSGFKFRIFFQRSTALGKI